jgi:hypothetical protein
LSAAQANEPIFAAAVAASKTALLDRFHRALGFVAATRLSQSVPLHSSVTGLASPPEWTIRLRAMRRGLMGWMYFGGTMMPSRPRYSRHNVYRSCTVSDLVSRNHSRHARVCEAYASVVIEAQREQCFLGIAPGPRDPCVPR